MDRLDELEGPEALDPVEQRRELLLDFRSRLEALPPAEFVVPAAVAKRKSGFLTVEAEGFLEREAAWALVRDAIDAAFGFDVTDPEPTQGVENGT